MAQINPREIIDRWILITSKESEIQQVGIDLTLKDKVFIPKGESLNVILQEKVFLPSDVFSTFTHRSSYNRKGILITWSIYDPWYEWVVGCTIYNLSGKDVEIDGKERIGQMVFFKANSASNYNGQWMREGLGKKN